MARSTPRRRPSTPRKRPRTPPHRRRRHARPSVLLLIAVLLFPLLYTARLSPTTDSRDDQLADLKRELERYHRSYPSNPTTQSRYILYRALGNDLPPRHAIGQTYRNVRFVLENEPSLEGLDKRWYVNRILDEEELGKVVRLLMKHRQTFTVDFLDLGQFAKTDVRLEGLNDTAEEDVLHSRKFRGWPEKQRAFLMDAVLHDQNQYLIHNNHARNNMLELGIAAGAEIVLPWDGNCFLNRQAWREIKKGVEQVSLQTDGSASKKYFVVPMARMTSNQPLLKADYKPEEANEEPQVIFRRDALERFSERMRYGRRPKVELLWRLQVAGPWDRWTQSAGVWEKKMWKESRDVSGRGAVKKVGWVARLFSGVGGLEGGGVIQQRGVSRSDGIERLIARAWGMWVWEDGLGLTVYDEEGLEVKRRTWKRDREVGEMVKHLIREATRVDMKGGFGKWARDVTVVTLAGYLTGEKRYSMMGAMEIRKRIIEGDGGLPTGSAGVCFAYLLDAVRLLHGGGLLSDADIAAVKRRVTPLEDTSGTEEYYNGEVTGVLYDVYAASVHAFLGDMRMVLRHTSLARGRLLGGVEENEVVAWGVLAEIARSVGVDVWGFRRNTEMEPILLKAVREYGRGTVYRVAKRRFGEALSGGGGQEMNSGDLAVPPFWELAMD